MARPTPTWREKLHDPERRSVIQTIPAKLVAKWGSGTVLIPAPIEVDVVMRSVPRGKLVTTAQSRERLAERHRATITCPITTGIFAVMAARAAEEELLAGRKRVTPYWRTLKAKGELNAKFPGGLGVLRSRLESEGHEVVVRGKRYFVHDYERFLIR